MSGIVFVILLIISLAVLIRLFFSPLRFIVKLIFNTAIGFVWLAVFNFFGANWLGFTLGFNIINSLIVGVFGLPGFVLLLLARLLLM